MLSNPFSLGTISVVLLSFACLSEAERRLPVVRNDELSLTTETSPFFSERDVDFSSELFTIGFDKETGNMYKRKQKIVREMQSFSNPIMPWLKIV